MAEAFCKIFISELVNFSKSVCVLNNDSVLTDILGTAINPQGPNATTDEPTMIIVTAVVYDAIVLNIPDTFNISLIDRIKALIQREASSSDSTQTKPPIIFTAPIMEMSWPATDSNNTTREYYCNREGIDLLC